MKHLKFYTLLLLPLLNSCTMVQEEYYAPPPRVEVQPYYPQPQNYHYHQQRRYSNYNRPVNPPNSGGKYHGHPEGQGNVVTVNPEPIHGEQEQGNVHGHNSSNVHGHN